MAIRQTSRVKRISFFLLVIPGILKIILMIAIHDGELFYYEEIGYVSRF